MAYSVIRYVSDLMALEKSMTMNPIWKICFTLLAFLAVSTTQAGSDKRQLLLTNVHIFDGVNEERIENATVLVVGNKIVEITTGDIAADGATVIDGGGRTLIPGLSDAHVHLMINDSIPKSIYDSSWGYTGAKSVAAAKAMLLRGFTAVRDAGGPVAGLKQAIDEGVVEGPRIFPSGPFISQTSGHGDFDRSQHRPSPYFTGLLDKSELMGWSFIADGVAEVTKAAREVLRTGATQIKVMAGGGVTSQFDPVDARQYTLEELRAIVTEAEKWDTYVLAHLFTDESAHSAIEAGVKVIEHGAFLSDETLKLMAKKGVWLSTQYFLASLTPEQFGVDGVNAVKLRMAKERADEVFLSAKRYRVKMAWGTDMFGSLANQSQQSNEFVARARYLSPFEILKQATSGNAELFSLSGKRHPYKEGPLGVIKVGAYADILLVNGNPLQEISLLADPDKNLALIMKDGVIYKNTLK